MVEAEGKNSTRSLYLMRHAERLDRVFTTWVSVCFNEQNQYIRKNLNMPLTVPERTGGPWDFFKDSPLTLTGLHQATITGDAMKEHGIKFSHVFCSPSLRCVETCNNILKATDQTHLPINIEPGLFEWLAWYKDGLPVWIGLEQLQSLGYNISLEYRPVIPVSGVTDTSETGETYYMRSYLLVKEILKNYPEGNILFAGHASTLDTCSRQLTGKAPRSGSQIQSLVQKISYASVAVVELHNDNTWHLSKPPFPPLMHANNLSFDWETLLS